MFGDPLYVKYFSAWGKKEKAYLLERWDELQGVPRKITRWQKALRSIGIGRARIAAQHNYGLHQTKSEEAVQAIVEEMKIEGTPEQLRALFFERIRKHLSKANHRNAEQQEKKMDEYTGKVEQAHRLVNGRVPERELFAMSLKGPVAQVIDDLETCSPEELCERILQSYQQENGR
jgi:hypothetical protein